MEEFKAYENDDKVKCVSKDDLINHPELYNIQYISFEDRHIIASQLAYILTDKDHPISVEDSAFGSSLHIYKSYYQNHQDEMNELVVNVIKNMKDEVYIFDTLLITPEVIDAISRNENITEVTLGKSSDVYYLDQETLNKLNNGYIKRIHTDGVDESLKDNYDDIITFNSYKMLIAHYNMKDLKENNKFYLDKSISDEEISNFKYTKEGIKIVFQYEDYENIFETISKIKELNKGYNYQIEVNDKEIFNNYSFNKDIDISNISVKSGLEEVDLKTYIDSEKMLNSMIEPAKDLSVFEKFLYAYDVTKHFKKYKESIDKDSARDLYKIVNNDEYMVCVGYANLLMDLLKRLGIDSYDYGVGVDTGYDKVDLNSEDVDVQSKNEGHARVIVKITDPKYNLDGIYISDPTWDNDLDNDLYTYALMTFDEASKNIRYLYKDYDITQLLYSKNINEFYERVNLYLNREIENNDDYMSPYHNRKAQIYFIGNVLDFLKNIDLEFYQEMKKWVQDLLDYVDPFDQNKFNEFVTTVGNYFYARINKPISKDTYIEAIKVLYTKFYGISEEEVLKEIDRTVDANKEKYNKSFPTIYRINQDGTKEVYSSLDNKWDEEEITRHR